MNIYYYLDLNSAVQETKIMYLIVYVIVCELKYSDTRYQCTQNSIPIPLQADIRRWMSLDG